MGKIVRLVVSLRAGSYIGNLMRNTVTAAPEGSSVSLLDGIGEIPLNNEDEKAEGLPGAVNSMAEAIWPADRLLITTPEYNYGTPGVLKMRCTGYYASHHNPFLQNSLLLWGPPVVTWVAANHSIICGGTWRAWIVM